MAPAAEGPRRFAASTTVGQLPPTTTTTFTTFSFPPWTTGDDDTADNKPAVRHRQVKRQGVVSSSTATSTTLLPPLPSGPPGPPPPGPPPPGPDLDPDPGYDSEESLSGDGETSDEEDGVLDNFITDPSSGNEKEVDTTSTALPSSTRSSTIVSATGSATEVPSPTSPDAVLATETSSSNENETWPSPSDYDGPTSALESSGRGDDDFHRGPSPRQRHHKNLEIALSVLSAIVGVCLLVVLSAANVCPAKGVPAERDPAKAVQTIGFPAERVSGERVPRQSRQSGSQQSDSQQVVADADPSAEQNPKIKLADVDELGLSASGNTLTTGDIQIDPRSQYRPPPVSPTGSSISSAFGNGTFIPPTPREPPAALRDTMRSGYFADENLPFPLMPPPTRRDTTYTQSSVSSEPRFRTVSSWVGQQTRRIGREPAPPVPEQGYGLMMPDDQEPRRVSGVPPPPPLPQDITGFTADKR
ncbi:hypothetical protein GMORB2_4410 [Geosmithia morbida]|uniref:Transmembrane protein n=1 Tax=Geosmithia morbida TaxID=1094350 RepID=A0A9P4YRL5_9HYPO|nr:uncharacterized protein GMORB2_4410 [Geosmithia morbida]KAF4119744.1 hypothetical protein GMORB2_4410 [Geosmithia morbida]